MLKDPRIFRININMNRKTCSVVYFCGEELYYCYDSEKELLDYLREIDLLDGGIYNGETVLEVTGRGNPASAGPVIRSIQLKRVETLVEATAFLNCFQDYGPVLSYVNLCYELFKRKNPDRVS